MEMRITPEWLRNKINTEPDIDFEAGRPVDLLEDIDMFLPPDVAEMKQTDEKRTLKLKYAFGLMVHHLRLRDSLTIDALASKATILAEELELIERDPHFQPRPRTVVQLARVFEIAPPKMMRLSGMTSATDQRLEKEVLKFAAKSDGVSSLNDDERKALNDFVKLLNKA